MLLRLPIGSEESTLLIEQELLESLSSFRQFARTSPEAGGILMGYRRGPHIHIAEATTPTIHDARSRFSFHRQADHHQRTALARWRESGETMDYVGEWHTHPENHPTPSCIDNVHWREISQASPRPMVYVILGRSSNWVGIFLREQLVRCVPY